MIRTNFKLWCIYMLWLMFCVSLCFKVLGFVGGLVLYTLFFFPLCSVTYSRAVGTSENTIKRLFGKYL